MDIQTLLYNLRKEVSCPECSDIFKDPRHLPCLHSFCLRCLEHWHRSSGSGNVIRCPTCQALGRVPASGDLKDLPTTFYLNGLIDVLAIKECNNTQVTCGNCDNKSSECSYCFQCCIFYCERCVSAHNIFKSNKDHRVLAIKEFQDKDYEDVLKRPAFCPRQGHQQEELKFFCKGCEAAVCQTCVILEHGGHTFKLIEEEAETQKTEMATTMQRQRQYLQAKMNLVTQLDEERSKLIEQGENLKKEAEVFADSLIKTILAKKENIIAVVENETKKSLESLKTIKAEIQEKIKLIESSLENADKLLTRSTNAEIVQLKKSLETILEGVVETEPIFHDPEGLLALVFVENQKILDIVNGEDIGSLQLPHQTKARESLVEGKGLSEGTVGREAQFNLTTRNAAKRQCYDERDRVTVEIRDEKGQECVNGVRIDGNNDGIYNISYSPRIQGKCRLSIMVNGEHVRDSPFLVLVKPFQVRPVFSFGEAGSSAGMFRDSRGLAVSARDEIAVTDFVNNTVQIFNKNGNFIRSFGRQGNNQGEFNHPHGIAMDKNNNIFVVDNGNSRIQIFSSEGDYQGNLDSQFSDPCSLSEDSDGNVIVADSKNQQIKIFSPEGKFLMKIGGQDSLKYPIHCVECDKKFIVSDMNGHCIVVFDREGNFQYRFGKLGSGEGEFINPRYLSVTKSGFLLVCDSGNHRIQVFEPSGQFVGKFGTKGSELGEFSTPWPVAVLSNDEIVVSDINNHRIQIFE